MSPLPLTKEDLAWVLVRLVGAYLLFSGLSAIFGALVGWWNMREVLATLPTARQAPLTSPWRTGLISALAPLAAGLYLITNGRIVHRVLMAVPPGPTDAIGLVGEELQEFRTWLERHPELAERPAVDQVALFRDEQARRDSQARE